MEKQSASGHCGWLGLVRNGLAYAGSWSTTRPSSYINGQEFLVHGGLSQTWLSLIARPGFEKQDSNV